jgi:hypothetical protein
VDHTEGTSDGRTIGRAILLGSRRFEFPRGSLQFPAKNAYVAGGLKGQGDSISSDPPDFDRDVITDVYPFSRFPTEHKHWY